MKVWRDWKGGGEEEAVFQEEGTSCFILLPFKQGASFVPFHLSGSLGGAEFAFFLRFLI